MCSKPGARATRARDLTATQPLGRTGDQVCVLVEDRLQSVRLSGSGSADVHASESGRQTQRQQRSHGKSPARIVSAPFTHKLSWQSRRCSAARGKAQVVSSTHPFILLRCNSWVPAQKNLGSDAGSTKAASSQRGQRVPTSYILPASRSSAIHQACTPACSRSKNEKPNRYVTVQRAQLWGRTGGGFQPDAPATETIMHTQHQRCGP